MAVITVQFELGPKTLAVIERLIGRAAMQLELGPETRELIDGLVRERAKGTEDQPRP